MSVAKLIDRLEGVRSTGPGRWLARCPAHPDKSPSLSIREVDDGRVLIHDFAGCDASDVLAAVGLELRDLFPERPRDHRVRPASPRIPAADALAALDHEAHVVAVIGADVHQHQEIDGATWERLSVAVRRIGETRALLAPPRIKVTA